MSAAPCATVEELRAALAAKPRCRARVYVTGGLHARLAAARLRPLEDFRGPPRADGVRGHRDTLRLGAVDGIAPPETSYWVEHVVYDDGYETPEEYGDPMVDWNESDHEDIRDVSKLWAQQAQQAP